VLKDGIKKALIQDKQTVIQSPFQMLWRDQQVSISYLQPEILFCQRTYFIKLSST